MQQRYERSTNGAESRFGGKDERGRVASVAARWRECLQLQGVRGLSPKHCVRMRCIPEDMSLFVSFECDSLSEELEKKCTEIGKSFDNLRINELFRCRG